MDEIKSVQLFNHSRKREIMQYNAIGITTWRLALVRDETWRHTGALPQARVQEWGSRGLNPPSPWSKEQYYFFKLVSIISAIRSQFLDWGI